MWEINVCLAAFALCTAFAAWCCSSIGVFRSHGFGLEKAGGNLLPGGTASTVPLVILVPSMGVDVRKALLTRMINKDVGRVKMSMRIGGCKQFTNKSSKNDKQQKQQKRKATQS